MNRPSTDQVLTIPVSDLAAPSGGTLCQLKNDAADRLAAAKAIVAHLDRALQLKYAECAHQQRLATGKGIVQFDDGPVRVTADLPERVEWDQALLAAVTRRIAAAGADPAAYVEISYRVSETKFNAWPETLQGVFAPARTLKTGTPAFQLTLEPQA